MSILSDFEDRVGRAIEGVFAGVFRGPVQPAELARAAAKEMDRRRKLGVGKVYAPTLYSVLISPADAEQLGGFTDTLAAELETYLRGYAQERDYELACRPRTRFLVDEDLKLGRFEVIGELLSPEQVAAEMGDDVAGASQVATPVSPGPEPDDASDTFASTGIWQATPDATPRLATVTVPGVAHDVALIGDRIVVGRLSACGICLDDNNVSREHAAFVRSESNWDVVDLESTNGTLVNGVRAARKRMVDGDIITIGVTELVYHEPRG